MNRSLIIIKKHFSVDEKFISGLYIPNRLFLWLFCFQHNEIYTAIKRK